eukprot:9437882-Ditylum_brightwellii.AAC.1
MSMIWEKIKFLDGKKTKGSITSLCIPTSWPQASDDDSSINLLKNPKTANKWRTAETPPNIAFYLKLWNQLHFGQGQGTPFTTPPLKLEADWAANLTTSELILE